MFSLTQILFTGVLDNRALNLKNKQENIIPLKRIFVESHFLNLEYRKNSVKFQSFTLNPISFLKINFIACAL
jgi:hypothetical protein